jgi:hypothetical protein
MLKMVRIAGATAQLAGARRGVDGRRPGLTGATGGVAGGLAGDNGSAAMLAAIWGRPGADPAGLPPPWRTRISGGPPAGVA